MNKPSQIDPTKLFSTKILKYAVTTSILGKVDYVNLDNAATTPPLKTVERGLSKYITSYGSVHRGAGKKSKISTDVYENSREIIKSFVNAPSDSYVLFTNNTTGAINTAAHFFSFLKGKIAVSSIEHSSSWLPWIKSEGIKALGGQQNTFGEMDSVNEQIQYLGRRQVLQYDVNENFEFDLDIIENLLKKNHIKVLVLTASSNVTGYCPDIKKIGMLAHRYGAYFLVDACQFLQHHKLDMKEMGIDFLAASGHKFYAPYGGGFLIGPKNFLDSFLPYQIGGGNLPYITKTGEFLRYRNQLAHDPGTPNAIGAVTMAIALEQLKKIGIDKICQYESTLTNKLFDALKKNPNVEMFVKKEKLGTVIPFRIKNMDSNEVAERLNSEYGIGVRAGSFCTYHVIRKLLGIKNDNAIVDSVKHGNVKTIPALIRASIALCNTNNDIERLIVAINKITS
ncbi:MAG: aminotransferase class V-fold PLP-dependent enzyme [Candidatus Magasanikbacteria bacterium]|jgi:cysteine desulfurase